MRYPADPPTVDEIVAVMRHSADDRHGWRVRAMIVVLWRAGHPDTRVTVPEEQPEFLPTN